VHDRDGDASGRTIKTPDGECASDWEQIYELSLTGAADPCGVYSFGTDVTPESDSLNFAGMHKEIE